MNRPFRDRVEAGELLARRLAHYARRDNVLILGLPRGGIPVAYEVAKYLHAPMDVFVVRKLGVPGYEELAMGAIASGDVRVLNDEVVRGWGIADTTIEEVSGEQYRELKRRERVYRGNRDTPEVRGKTVVLVDDGIATGSTMRAAVQALRHQEPARLVVAVPVAPGSTIRALERDVDEVITLMTPWNFSSVGQWYEDFTQTTDSDVTRLVAEAASHFMARYEEGQEP